MLCGNDKQHESGDIWRNNLKQKATTSEMKSVFVWKQNNFVLETYTLNVNRKVNGKVKEFIIEKDLENQYVKALVNPIFKAVWNNGSCKDHAKTLSVTKVWCIKVHEKLSLNGQSILWYLWKLKNTM